MEYVGMLMEMNGEVVGEIIDETKTTLLVRKGFVATVNSEQVLVLGERAMFVERNLLLEAYWIKLSVPTIVSKTVDCVDGSQLIREFMNV